MHKKFDNAAIEAKWQEEWQKSGLYDVGERNASAEKEYVLVEWPYPSGNLHIGHWHAFAVPDIYVRFLRMTGKQVIYPMGFDAFGLPAENAAIKRDINPREWTESNIAHMREQLGNMGNAFSWDKTTSSTDPEYYQWTQWMFTKFFEKGIAYRGSGIVNWDPVDNTVIANEQVLPDGTSERSGALVEKKVMAQWMLKITDYADRLVDDLDQLNWPEHIKEAQRQWIGRSQGAELDFKLSTGDTVTVFTTRPDTLFGATYLVLAPEHDLVQKNKDAIQNWDEVASYTQVAAQKDEQDRLNDTKEKTGVLLEVLTATNPGNGEEIPVFIADYVLASYGTGAIMAVPAHDERDYEFAKKFQLPIHTVISNYSDPDNFEKEFEGDFDLPYSGGGYLVQSDEFNGMDSEEAKEAIVEKVGGRMSNTYRLRDWSVGRQRYWGVPIPIVYDPDGNPHPVPQEHLPWLLPEDVDFRPTGEAPLAKSAELKERTEKIFGEGWTPEVETLDTFVDSSWYYLRYLDNHNDESLSDTAKQQEWMPIDIYFGGAEHTTLHLLYSRFWQKALYDLGLAVHDEPYTRRINRGLILGPDGNKMSKSKGNVIDPDEQVARVGSDTVKMYLAFMGPYGEVANYPWDMGGIAGLRRFLERVYGLSEHVSDSGDTASTQLLHQTIAKVRTDIAAFKFNTAISAMMTYINTAEKAGLTAAEYELFLRLLAPFAPHLAEELWSDLGHSESIHRAAYPEADEELAKQEEVTIGVQVNGKRRGSVTLPVAADESEAVAAATASAEVARHTDDKEIIKVVYVPGRILNLMVKE
jgi:leucyl-tRNA synthetase